MVPIASESISPFLSAQYLDTLGIGDWGYTESPIPQSYSRFRKWILRKKNGPLSYLSDHRGEMRGDIRFYYPEFESALVFIFPYNSTRAQLNQEKNLNFSLASYTMAFDGLDYHQAIGQSLNQILDKLQSEVQGLQGVRSLDIHPVLERDLAYRAGLGWFGKSSMLISRKHGPFFLIGSLFLNQKLNLDKQDFVADHCGSCRRCVDSCPTEAIEENTRTINASQCLSTFSIETRGDHKILPKTKTSIKEVFGCDICQSVCPWSHRPLSEAAKNLSGWGKTQKTLLTFFLPKNFSDMKARLENFSEKQFGKIFKGTVFTRPGRKGLLKNYEAVEKNQGARAEAPYEYNYK